MFGNRQYNISQWTDMPNSYEVMHAYVDSDWQGDPDGSMSTMGYIVYVFGAPVLVRSAKQEHVALSSCEA